MQKQKPRKPMVRRSLYSVVDDLSEAIKAIYTECFRRREFALRGSSDWTPGPWWNGGVVRGTRRPNMWKRVAKFMLDNELPLLPFIRFAVFDFNKRALPKPTLLASKVVAEKYRIVTKASESNMRQVQVEFDMQQQALRLALSWYDEAEGCGFEFEDDAEIKRRVLLDASTSMSALFRYCLAVAERLDGIVEHFYSAALIQYATTPKVYDIVWKEWIPAAFKEDARNLSRCCVKTVNSPNERVRHG